MNTENFNKIVNIECLLDEYRNLLTEKAKKEISENKLIQFIDFLCPYWFDTEKGV